MLFYKYCLGGEIVFQTVGESPQSEHMPKKMKNCILHSTLTCGSLVLMGTDIVPGTELIQGNSVSLSLYCNSPKETQKIYKKLSAGGESTHPLAFTFWGDLFGGLTDKYGNHWLLLCSSKDNEK
jgi:PhnB protein